MDGAISLVEQSNMNKYICPECKQATSISLVQCPKYEQYICLDHCYQGCSYLENRISITSCRYRESENEKHGEKEDIKKEHAT